MINGKVDSIKDRVLSLVKGKTASYDHKWSNSKRQYFNYSFHYNNLQHLFNVNRHFRRRRGTSSCTSTARFVRATSALFLSRLTAMMTRPLFAYLRCTEFIHGNEQVEKKN